jgi:hypothetical protein
MKIQFLLAGSTLAALGISLMTISCDNKSEEADSGSETSDPGTAEAAPTGQGPHQGGKGGQVDLRQDRDGNPLVNWGFIGRALFL